MAGPNQYRPGVGSVGQYQMSAKPFLSSSILVSNTAITEIKFPAVTSFLTIQNVHAGSNVPLVVAFSSNGLTGDEGYKILLDNIAQHYHVFFQNIGKTHHQLQIF